MPKPTGQKLELIKKKLSEKVRAFNASEVGQALNKAKSTKTHLNLNSPKAIAKRNKTFKERGHGKGAKNSQFGKTKSKEHLEKLSKTSKENWAKASPEKKAAQLDALAKARASKSK